MHDDALTHPSDVQTMAVTRAARASAGPCWDLGFEGRPRRLRAWRREIAGGGEELAALIYDENGEPTSDARAEALAGSWQQTSCLSR